MSKEVAAGLLKRRAVLTGEADALRARVAATMAHMRRLAVIGVEENERNLRNKVSRGKLMTGFLLQVRATIEAKDVRLNTQRAASNTGELSAEIYRDWFCCGATLDLIRVGEEQP